MSKLENPEEQEPVVLDFTGLKEALIDVTKTQIAELKEALKPESTAKPRGQIVRLDRTKLVENLHDIPKAGTKMTEQWTVTIVNYATAELAAHMRDYVWTQELLKDEQGDVANIPYIGNVDFEQLAAVGNAFAAAWTNLVSNLTTTLYEAGGYYDLPYYLLERIDGNLLEEINNVLAVAAMRSEDAKMMALINSGVAPMGTGTNFAGECGRKTGPAYFYSANIPTALGLLMARGKNIRPAECVLYMTPMAYKALLEELISNQVLAYADPTLIKKGLIEQLIGVSIVVGGYRTYRMRTVVAATGTVDVCFLMRGKRAVGLAPKRDLLIETDKQIAARTLRITSSHTFGVKILDFKEIVRVWTSYKA